MSAAIVTRDDGLERRARLLPWGIEVQVWRLVETLTFPSTAAGLPLDSLFPLEPSGAIPCHRSDDEETLETVLDKGSRDDGGASPPECGKGSVSDVV
jgi:hypothetical protein